MKIGDEVYVHGYVDEIRKDVVIIRNEGGYFGTVEDEIVAYEIKGLHKDYAESKVVIEQTDCEITDCDYHKYCKEREQTDCAWK